MTTILDFPRPYGVVMAEASRVCRVAVEPTLDEALGMSVAWSTPDGEVIGAMRDCPTVALEGAAKAWLGYMRDPVHPNDSLAYWTRYRAARLVLDHREGCH